MPSGISGSNPPQKFVCELCGAPFIKKWYPSQKKPRFCSVVCRQRNNSRQKPSTPQSKWKHYRACLNCGDVSKRDGDYCIRCLNEIRTQNKKEKQSKKKIRKPNPPQKFTCEGCGKVFSKIWYPSRRKPRYCSRKCRKPQTVVVCKICGVSFEIFPSRKDTIKYCSQECASKGREKKKRATKQRAIKKCKRCGKEFIANRNDRKYCSHRCAMNARKETRLKKTCEACGKEFIVKKGYAHARFCSIKCASVTLAQRGPDNPNWKGGHNGYRGKNWTEQSKKARKRDGYACQHCGKTRRSPALSVHHIIPFRYFNGDYISANKLSNLVTLCRHCHSIAEASIKERDVLGRFEIKASLATDP